LEYGNSDFDVRHRFVIDYAYQLPFGHGQRLGGNASGALNQIIGNWQVAGITTVQTGNWFTITESGAISSVSTSDGGGAVGFNQVRPNVVGNPNGTPCMPGTLFNTCAFATNTTYFTFGNAGRNIVRGPGLQNWDFSIFKLFPGSRTDALRIPGGILQHMEPCKSVAGTCRRHQPGAVCSRVW
jgi:hypothetical protein